MSIKPITYQGLSNFRANLYALEVRSRFIDQNAADGYYKGYGDELAAVVSANVITIGSGAFLVQGRLNEIDAGGEAISVTIQNGYVGYIIARIETYHSSDTENCTIFARTGTTLEAITLSKEDTYQKGADSQNKVYELPLYSFSMSGGAITDLKKLIQPVEESTRTRAIANEALATIKEAYAKIEEMLEQSYVENAGTAKNADEAASLSEKFFCKTSITKKSIDIELNTKKSYVISFCANNSFHTVILFPASGTTTHSTSSGYYGYYCKYTYDDGVHTILFMNGEGENCEVTYAYIREL